MRADCAILVYCLHQGCVPLDQVGLRGFELTLDMIWRLLDMLRTSCCWDRHTAAMCGYRARRREADVGQRVLFGEHRGL